MHGSHEHIYIYMRLLLGIWSKHMDVAKWIICLSTFELLGSTNLGVGNKNSKPIIKPHLTNENFKCANGVS
jgi:hypothetical protein